MKSYNTIMGEFTWEGIEEEVYQHLRRCMDHVEMVEIHKSMEELSQPPFSSFGKRGDLPMDHSILDRKSVV